MEHMGEVLTAVGICAALAVGGFIADNIDPKMPFINRFIDDLPMMRAEETEERSGTNGSSKDQ